MPLVVMVGTNRISTVISGAAIAGERKYQILVLVITDPVPATFGPDQLNRLAAQVNVACLQGGWFALGHMSPSRIV